MTIIGQRLELSGMRWIVEGAAAIIAVRCREASRQRDDIWPPPQPDSYRLTRP